MLGVTASIPLQDLMTTKYGGVSVLNWAIAAGIAVGVTLALRLVKWGVCRWLARLAERSPNKVDDMISELASHTKLVFLFGLGLLAGAVAIEMPEAWEDGLGTAVWLITLFQVGIWGGAVIRWVVDERMKKATEEDAAASTGATMLRFAGLVLVWALVVIVALENLGQDVTALVAGLGVGGIAVALAAQSILSDLFASVSILLDKPFLVGDFVIVGDFMGNIEKIGLKTTRIRGLGGEQLIFCNSDLLQSRLRNYKRMQERRIVFAVSVTYQISADQLERIPDMVRDIVQANEQARFDRCHFARFGASSLEIEIVYYVLSADYTLYMDLQESINMAIYRKFAEENIEFAYPTQTVYLPDVAATGSADGAVRPAAGM